MKPDIEKANRSIARLLILALYAGVYFLLWVWWQSTGAVFSEPIASASLGELIYGVASRAMALSIAVGSLALLPTLWRGN